jgi:hypothetical protein
VVDDQHVEAPERLRRVRDDALRRFRIGEVGAQVDGARQLGRRVLGRLQREPVALPGEPKRERVADALGAPDAGDQRRPRRQSPSSRA